MADLRTRPLHADDRQWAGHLPERCGHYVRLHLPRSALFALTLLLVFFAGGCAAGARGGRKPLTADLLFGPGRLSFSGTYPTGLRWLSDGRHYLQRIDDVLHRVCAASGQSAPAYDVEAFEQALRDHEDFDEQTARRLARHPTELADDHSCALLAHKDRLYVYRFDTGLLQRLADEQADRRVLTLSPDGQAAAFVLENNLFVIDTTTGVQTRLTSDGSDTLLNGLLDWVYQEEIFGRGQWRGYWWSGDGRYLAYLQLDESDVPTYPLVDYLQTHPTVEPLRYPRAGDPNPRARIGVVPRAGGDTIWVDLSPYDGTDILIVGVSWAPDGRLVYAVQDRESRWLDLNAADAETGVARTLLHEESPAWVDYAAAPRWLDDGSFLWLSARDGWQHVYHYTHQGSLIRQVTAGSWEVRELHGVDAERGWVYFSGTRDSPVETHAYRVPLEGGEVERLTVPGFSHRVDFDPQFAYFIDTFSSVSTPPEVHLRRSDGALVRPLSDGNMPLLREYRLSAPQIVRVPTPYGYALNAMIIRPPDFSRWRKYPLLVHVYGGPQAPVVHNRWGGHHYMFKQWLAQQGYIVWTCDPHSASGEGAVSAWRAYQRLGATELADIEASVRWLAARENVDLTRVGIMGGSYGGYLAAYALTHSTMFKTGIAISALTDWRNYDSVYAERFMRTPDNNPDGYEAASVLAAAERLHGRLLLVHGAADDNVHLHNAFQLMHALQEADKDVDVLIYPRDDHGVYRYTRHWYRLLGDYLKRNL